jgi:hypothetical protein
MSLPNKACNVQRGRISIIGSNARKVNPITSANRALASKVDTHHLRLLEGQQGLYDESFYVHALEKRNSSLSKT